MIEELFEGIESALDSLNRKFYGVCVAEVVDVNDPLQLGRVQVKLPFIDESDRGPWARTAQPMAGMLYGFYFIPSVGDEVLVCFEHGDVAVPYILGSLWNAMSPPPIDSPQGEQRAVRTPGGAQLVFGDRPSRVTLQTAPTTAHSLPEKVSGTAGGHGLDMGSDGIMLASPKQVKLEVSTTTLEVTPSGVKITCGGTTLELTSASAELKTTSLKLVGSGSVEIQGGVIKLNS